MKMKGVTIGDLEGLMPPAQVCKDEPKDEEAHGSDGAADDDDDDDDDPEPPAKKAKPKRF